MMFSVKPNKVEFFAQPRQILSSTAPRMEEEFNSDDLFILDFDQDDDEEIGAGFESLRY